MKDLIEIIIREELRIHSYRVSDACIADMVDRIADAVEEF